MNLIRFAINNPVKISVGVILTVLFGLLSVFRIPIQLTPDVDRPIITVTTEWIGASPQEVEREVVERQEQKLKSVTGLRKITSTSRESEGAITLEFFVGVDKDDALRDTIEKINQVGDYPAEVERPEVAAADPAADSPIAWLVFSDETGADVSTMRDFVEDDVKPILERVLGVASINVYGGRERQVQVRVDAAKLASRGLTFQQLADALRDQNRNISAGSVTQQKLDYTYRTVGRYERVEDVEATIIVYDQGGPVLVRDVATVVKDFKRPRSFVRNKGRYVLALPVRRETGANVIATMEGLQAQVDKVNREILGPRKQALELTQVYDETVYIRSSINRVINNLFVGGTLAIAILVLFLRSGSATLIAAVAIPISVVGSFLAVALLGRSLNVIMLAGMAFAVGMVVDNAIVVLENIFRHRQMGKSRTAAALDGTHEVWGAILASTLTTIAVFLPIVFVEEEAGQLFRDIAIAIVSAVGLSLIVAVSVVPTLSARLLGRARTREGDGHAGRLAGWVAGLVGWVNRSVPRRLAIVLGLTGLSLFGSWMLVPPASYLPSGNRNLVFGWLVTPPGYSLDEFRRIARNLERQIRPYWEAQPGTAAAAALPEVSMGIGEENDNEHKLVPAPPIDNFFFAAFDGKAIMGCTSAVESAVTPLVEVFDRTGGLLPGVFTHFSQMSLFGRGTGGNSIAVEVRGENLDELIRVAKVMSLRLMGRFAGYPRPNPGNFDIGRPELRVIPDRERAADLGLSVVDVGFAVRACIEGAYVGEFRDQGDDIDLVIKVVGLQDADLRTIASSPIATAAGQVIPMSSVVRFDRVYAPQEIAHIEAMPAVTFDVSPPPTMALESAMGVIQEEIIQPLRQDGTIPGSIITSLAGNADKLVQTRRALIGNYTGLVRGPRLFGQSTTVTTTGLAIAAMALGAVVLVTRRARGHSGKWGIIVGALALAGVAVVLLAVNPELALELLQSRGLLALLVTYLLMAALFESFVFPFVIMLSVPLATLGGFAGLAIVHAQSLRNPLVPVQQLDVLTMLGFIILVGIVVNNAILIVHQSLNNMQVGRMKPQEAIRESVRTRVRPIFMTALTSIGGMLPLVIMSGAGSELYRGLGSVLVGGLAVSSVFTLLLVPAMFSLFVSGRAWVVRQFADLPAEALAPPPPAAGVVDADQVMPVGIGPAPRPVHRFPQD